MYLSFHLSMITIYYLGAKFLWWTWHDTDAPVNIRLLGAPVGKY